MFYFSPLCVLKCCLKWFALHEVLSQMLHYYTLKRFLSGMWRCGILCALAKHCQIFTTPNVLSQNIVIYLPHQIQLKCVETVFLLNVAWCIFKCALRFPTNEDAKPHWLHYDKHVIFQNWFFSHIFHKNSSSSPSPRAGMPARSQRSKNNDVHRDLVSELIALVFPALHVTTATLDSFFQVS